MKHTVRLSLVMLALVLAFAVMPQTVFAHDDHNVAVETEEQSQRVLEAVKKLYEQRKEAAEKRRQEAKEALESVREEAKQQLAERFKEACENRRANYQNRLQNIAERSQKHVGVLDKILERVKAFKKSKNLTVENYEALVAEAEAKKLVAHDVQEVANAAAGADFSCEPDAARESVAAFKDILHQQINALKGYKTAVKNLIVAVKTAAVAAEGVSDESEE